MKKEITIFSLIIIADQILKLWVKTHMFLGQEHKIFGNWFIIHFTENNASVTMTIFKLLIAFSIVMLLYLCNKKKVPKVFSISLAIFLAGIVGNIIDVSFYSLIFNDSMFQVASMFPKEGGYSSFLYGNVVNMLYFPIIDGHFPKWFPFWGGEQFIFFRSVINLATITLFIGFVTFIIALIKKLIFLIIFKKIKSKPQSNNEIEEILKLNDLKNQGAISEEEYNKLKTKTLNL